MFRCLQCVVPPASHSPTTWQTLRDEHTHCRSDRLFSEWFPSFELARPVWHVRFDTPGLALSRSLGRTVNVVGYMNSRAMSKSQNGYKIMKSCRCMKSCRWWILLLLTTYHSAAAERPNILFIMADDHTFQAIGAYGRQLAALNPTPNIDSLAANGMRFDQVFCTNSICTPSRATIITGQYCQTN